MKVYVLRHEIRSDDNSFNSTLTKQGITYAIDLADRLHKLNIKTIYCSPFVRAIQTIHPYSIKYNVKINIDYAVIEYIERPDILPERYNVLLTPDELSYWNINSSYCSSLTLQGLTRSFCNNFETMENIKYRTANFIDYLQKTIIPSTNNGNILIVSHKTTIDCLWQHIHKKSRLLDMGEIDILCDL